MNSLKICSCNMFDFNNGVPLLNILCQSYDIILLQEHWLATNDLGKLNNIDSNFTSFSVSAMDSKIESGILTGRPFGGTAILFKSTLLKYITLIETDTVSGRYISVRYHCNDVDINECVFSILQSFS